MPVKAWEDRLVVYGDPEPLVQWSGNLTYYGNNHIMCAVWGGEALSHTQINDIFHATRNRFPHHVAAVSQPNLGRHTTIVSVGDVFNA